MTVDGVYPKLLHGAGGVQVPCGGSVDIMNHKLLSQVNLKGVMDVYFDF